MERPKVVVIGGGFGGLAAVRGLRRAAVDVTLVDKRNHHLFQPLLYQVATAGLAPSDIAEPLRAILADQRNVDVVLGEVVDVDRAGRAVLLADGRRLPYDHLVVAAGATTTWYGHEDWAAHAPGLKTIGEALSIRHRILGAFERAEQTADPVERRRLLTFVVAGGGPTGVEMAGAIREIALGALASEYAHIDPRSARVILVEGAPSVLMPFPPRLRDAARRQLEQLGVEVRTGERVEAVAADHVVLGDDRIEAATVVWAAGVRGVPLAAALSEDLDRAGRVPVAADLSLPGHPEVFVIGDLAHVEDGAGGTVPGVAPAAIQMGTHAARAIRADLARRARRPFRYVDRGSLATIGRVRAVAHLGPLKLAGLPAWVLWVFVHLMTLVGHRNRAVVFVKWAWAWATWDRSSRLLWQDEVVRDAQAAEARAAAGS